jgi:phosphoribosyl-ATP pyrophosphohydrolase
MIQRKERRERVADVAQLLLWFRVLGEKKSISFEEVMKSISEKNKGE